MDDNIRFYIPNGITIPTALILYVGDIYVCYSKIKGGFRFHIHEDDEEKAMEIAKQIAHKMEYECIINSKISTIYNDSKKKRVYVNITMDHYLFAKKKTGASLGTLQDYFDALIEYDKQHHIISYD